ncbi:ABC transporter permease subunit [Streptomyces sp. NBC_01020]|uniref:ABC transporter permease subunit n=1 Tax=unclassified Streptomyces TaxID=2593676 RepID=UPI002E1F360C|nr:ABC transporter permease subunit [Streptomyces sp. NBC_01020]WSX68458.1 ABC transporter permease subunit [Streptomyces sp. NBC_00932]
MTTASLDKPAPSLRPSGLDLFRAELRLHRAALWSWTAYVVVTAGLLLWLYGPGANATQKLFDKFGYAGVQQAAWHDLAARTYFSGFDSFFYDPATLISAATFCVAVFAAGPLIARELESGTTRLAWSQSVSPARWLAAKLAVPAVVLVVSTGVLIVLYRLLWSSHSGLLVAGYQPRQLYFSIGPAAVVAPLFALALGALCGMLLRRTLPAMLAAAVIQYAVTAVRSGLWPFQRAYQVPELSVHSRAITSTGARITDPECYDKVRCLAQHDVTGFTRTYLPSSDFWPRQLLESGVLLALTALAVGVAFWVLKRRTA